MTTTLTTAKVITYNRTTKDFDATFDGQYIGSFPSYLAAEEALNDHALRLIEDGLVDLPLTLLAADPESPDPGPQPWEGPPRHTALAYAAATMLPAAIPNNEEWRLRLLCNEVAIAAALIHHMIDIAVLERDRQYIALNTYDTPIQAFCDRLYCISAAIHRRHLRRFGALAAFQRDHERPSKELAELVPA